MARYTPPTPPGVSTSAWRFACRWCRDSARRFQMAQEIDRLFLKIEAVRSATPSP